MRVREITHARVSLPSRTRSVLRVSWPVVFKFTNETARALLLVSYRTRRGEDEDAGNIYEGPTALDPVCFRPGSDPKRGRNENLNAEEGRERTSEEDRGFYFLPEQPRRLRIDDHSREMRIASKILRIIYEPGNADEEIRFGLVTAKIFSRSDERFDDSLRDPFEFYKFHSKIEAVYE